MEPSNRLKLDRARVRCLPLLAALLFLLPAATWAASPTISSIADQTIDANSDTGNIDFDVDDAETSPGDLTLSKNSSDTALVPLANIVFSGTGMNRRVKVTPAANRSGIVTITVTVTDDDTNSTSTTFDVIVKPVVEFSGAPAGITDKQTRRPFTSISIAASDPITVSIRFPNGRGSFPETTGFTNRIVGTNVIYDLSSRSPADAREFLTNLVFTPVENRIPVDETETTTFLVTATDADDLSGTNSVDLDVTSVNDAPRILGQVLTPVGDNQNSKLFGSLRIEDVDKIRTLSGVVTNQPVTVTVSNGVAAGGPLTLGGFLFQNNPFTLSDTPARVTSVLTNVQFAPVPNLVPVGQSNVFNVRVTVSDGSTNSPDNFNTNVVILSINDPPTVTTTVNPANILDTQDLLPFSLAITDPDLGETNFTVFVTQLTSSSFGSISPPGPFSGDPATVAAAVHGIGFTPVRNIVTNSQVVRFRFSVTNHSDAVLVTNQITVNEVNELPEIFGAAVFSINDDTTVNPFNGVTIQDLDRGGLQPVTVTMSMDDTNKGTLVMTNSSGPLNFSSVTPAAATLAIRQVKFIPKANRLPVNQSDTTILTIVVVDAFGGPRTNNATQVTVTSVNGAPQILGVSATQPLPIPPAEIVKPFGEVQPYTPGISISDDDTNVTLKITIDNAAKGYLTNLGGFADLGGGVYQIVTNPAAATVALTNLDFQISSTFQFPLNSPGGTTFALNAKDTVNNQANATLSIVLQESGQNHLVTRTDDDLEPGSLRHAAMQVENNGMITFALSNYPTLIRLSTNFGPIVLGRHISVKGPGADLLTISGDSDGNGSPDTQLFRVQAIVTMEGMTLTKGRGQTSESGGISGGAVYVGPNGRLTMRGCAVTDSTASQWGGGIDVDGGSLAMSHCLVRGNSTDLALGLGGGGISLYSDLPCSFVNTTFSANRQRAPTGIGGGAVYLENFDPGFDFPVVFTHCTFAQNEDTSDAGSSISANVFGTMVLVRNSIFADGRSRNMEVQGSALIFSAGGNVSDDSTRTIITQNGQPQAIVFLDRSTDLTNRAPQLIMPFNLSTAGYVLQGTSPAKGLAVEPSESTDQRGILRDAHPDSGALELGALQRMVVNEIHFDPATNQVDFIELYVLRDSDPIDLNGFTLRVDGTNRYTFSGSRIIQPGKGVVFADTNIIAGDTNFPTLVISNILGGKLNLQNRGLVELLRPDGKLVLSVSYLGQFVDPFEPLNKTKYAHDSITLAPQFRGFAFLPHRTVRPPPFGGGNLAQGGASISPGFDTSPTPFGSPNAFPFVAQDQVLVNEDQAFDLPVLDNDFDADGKDKLVIVDVSTTGGAGGNDATALTAQLATVKVSPSGSPLRGSSIIYDPRYTTNLQQLAEGARKTDTFYYTIVDIGTNSIDSYQSFNSGQDTKIVSPAHRLTNGVQIVISGSGTAAYNGTNTVTYIDADSFSIEPNFVNDPAVKGAWVTAGPRQPTAATETNVIVTVLGINDPPRPAADQVVTDEETPLRIMADPNFAGTTNAFDTDSLYTPKPTISSVNLLNNDSDPDTDDNKTTLKVIGVVQAAYPITSFAGTNGLEPVIVTSTNHGLADGTEILISGYGGHPSYNGYHVVTLLDANRFSLAIPFVDHDPTNAALWTILDDDNRLNASSEHGAAVQLEIRADRTKTCIVYDPSISDYLNSTALGETNTDSFYYAVQDSHSAVSLAKVTIRVIGVNDPPVLNNDPGSLALLNSLINPSNSLGKVLSELEAIYFLPPGSGSPNRSDAQVQFSNATTVASFLLPDLWTTDEDTPLPIGSAEVLINDTDVDASDVLSVGAVAPFSWEGAALSLDTNGVITYDPTTSASLNSLAREELRIDSFEITVTDSEGGNVTNRVSVLVVGINDTPVARDDNAGTPEDVPFTIDPILYPTNNVALHDTDADINGHNPDNQLTLVPVTNALTGVGATVSIVGNNLTYDPTTSSFLNSLAHTQMYVDTFEYTVIDGSFVFANVDLFRVERNGTDYVLNVLANDRNFSGQGGELHIVSVGTPNQRGTVVNTGTNILYTPELDFADDEIFIYTVSDETGNMDSALVTVRVTVNQQNGNLQVNNDNFSVARGEAPLLDVLANDNILPALGSDLIITGIVVNPTAGGSAVVEGNQIRYTPNPAALVFPYIETFSYGASGGFTATAVGRVTILVVDRQGTLNTRDDAFSVQAGSQNNLLDVLLNDNILPGSADGLTIKAVFPGLPFHGQLATNDQHTAVIYTPDAGFVGEDTFTYVVTDSLGGTGSGQVTISVGSLATSPDFFIVPFNTNAPRMGLDILANDFVLQGTAGTNITVTLLTALSNNLPAGMLVIGPGATNLIYNPTNGVVGEYELAYTISDGFGRTAVGRATLVVLNEGVKANADFFTVGLDSSVNDLDVLANDVAIPDLGRPLTIVGIGEGVDAPNHGGTVTLNDANDGLIYTPAAGFIGEETFTYTMTDSRQSDTVRVVVRVTAGDLSANDDVFTVFFEIPAGSTNAMQFTLPVLANDTVLPNGGQELTITTAGFGTPQATNAPSQTGEVLIGAGATSLVYRPRDTNGPFPYVERIAYEITDGTVRRAAAIVTVEVQQRVDARELDTMNDAFTVERSSQNNLLPVLLNDNVKPASSAGWIITDVSASSYNGLVAIDGTNINYTPQPGFVGIDTFTYSVSDGLGGTGTAEVMVKVGDLMLCEDVFTAISGSTNNPMDVLANDAIRHETAETFVLLDAGQTSANGIVAVAGGVVLYTPDPAQTNYPYVETFLYRVQDDSLGVVTGRVAVTVYELGNDRDSATLNVTVQGVNDAPTIDGAAPAGTITDKQTIQLFPGVTIGEVDAQGLQPLTVQVILDQARGIITSLGNFSLTAPGVYTFNGTASNATTAIRALIYDPIENRITVPTSETTTFTISVSDGIVSSPVLDTNTVVTVIATNDPPLISGTVSNQTVYHHWSIRPFSSVTISEVDDLTLQPLIVTVSLNATNGFLSSLGNFVDLGNGVYRLGTTNTGFTAAAASAALRALVFNPTTGGRVLPGSPETTRFTITVEDGFAAPVINDETTVIAIHEFVTKIAPADGNTTDLFGAAVAASEHVVAVGATQDDDRGNNSGSAYIFVHSPGLSTQWVQFQKLVPLDLAAGHEFGNAMAISSNTLAVAAHLGGAAPSAGAVYLFERPAVGSNWVQVQKLIPFDGANGDDFGSSVSLDRNTLVVGARADDDNGTSSGSAYVYMRNAGTNTWSFVQKLTAGDPAAGDEFGQSVSIDANAIVVGSPLDVHNGVRTGSAYVFGRNPGSNTWTQVKKLLPSDGLTTDGFGFSVSVSRDTAAVGARTHDHVGNDAGAVYMFKRNQGGTNFWGELKELPSPVALNNDQFGYSVSINWDKMVGGLPFSGLDNQSKYGAAFAYGQNLGGTDNWGVLQKLDRSDALNNDQFGNAVSLGQNTAVVGASSTDPHGNDSGSIYIYRLKYNNAPHIISPIANQTAYTNVLFTFTLPGDVFSDSDVEDFLTLSASLADGSPLPAWLSFSGLSGAFNGTPTAPGLFLVRVTATDQDGSIATADFSITVSGGSNQPVAPAPPLVLYIFDDAANNRVLLSYQRPLNSIDANYLLETSTDLASWGAATPLVLGQSITPLDASKEQVVLAVSRTALAGNAQLFRVRKL